MVAIGLIRPKIVDPAPNYPSRHVDEPWKYVELQPKWIDSIWGSLKYGAEGNWFWNDECDNTTFWCRYKWLALRNPTSNLERKFPWISARDIPGSEIQYRGNLDISEFVPTYGWYYTWYKQYGQFRAVLPFPSKAKMVHIRYGFKMSVDKELDDAKPTLMINFK